MDRLQGFKSAAQYNDPTRRPSMLSGNGYIHRRPSREEIYNQAKRDRFGRPQNGLYRNYDNNNNNRNRRLDISRVEGRMDGRIRRGCGRWGFDDRRDWSMRPQNQQRGSMQEEYQQEKPKTILSEETLIARMRVDDGGVYTDDEEDAPFSTIKKEPEISESMEMISEEIIIVTARTEYIPIQEIHETTKVETVNSKSQAIPISSAGDGISNDMKEYHEPGSIEPNHIPVHVESKSHIYFGNKRTSDLDFDCGPYTLHAHRQIFENFVEDISELCSGRVEDWISIKKICEILYNHRLSDEKFLQYDNEMKIFWAEGNSIMHLANKLGIPVVKSYMDRAVAFYRCEKLQNCTKCSQQRRLFASIFGLEETKACLLFEAMQPLDDLDDVIDKFLSL